jgi:molybdopterin-guanine dinucleotide biosynthesis protein A
LAELPAPPLLGLVLAGGQSTRYGTDKATLVVAGQDLLTRTADLLASCGLAVRVAARADQQQDPLRRRHALLADEPGWSGPAAGLVAAWRLDPQAAWLAVACDMPRLGRAVIEALVAARDPSCQATAYLGADGRPEPLCAIYEPATLARLAAGPASSSLRRLLEQSRCRLLAAPGTDALASANTPADFHRLTRQ